MNDLIEKYKLSIPTYNYNYNSNSLLLQFINTRIYSLQREYLEVARTYKLSTIDKDLIYNISSDVSNLVSYDERADILDIINRYMSYCVIFNDLHGYYFCVTCKSSVEFCKCEKSYPNFVVERKIISKAHDLFYECKKLEEEVQKAERLENKRKNKIESCTSLLKEKKILLKEAKDAVASLPRDEDKIQKNLKYFTSLENTDFIHYV